MAGEKGKKIRPVSCWCYDGAPCLLSAWCAAGYCFSLQRDKDSALKYFKRAIFASPVPNPYGYTLCGHECLAKENFDQAPNNYRGVLYVDERHCNVLYGIGQVA